MSFLLPNAAPAEAVRELERACRADHLTHVPVPTHMSVTPQRADARRDLDESGPVFAPWAVEGAGRFMLSTGTLMERAEPYDILIELARGRVNQVRGQTADWRMIGLQVPARLEEATHTACLEFARAVCRQGTPDCHQFAESALRGASGAAHQLAMTYVDQVMRVRHQKQPKLDTRLAARVFGPVPDHHSSAVAAALNEVVVPLTWGLMEPASGQYKWESADPVLAWAESRGMTAAAGPLIDFSRAGLPEWVNLWEGDLASLSSVMCDYVETAIARYKGRVRRWQLTAGSNKSRLLGLGEDEQLWLAARLAEAALQADPDAELSIGLAQPWAEYMTNDDSTYSPLVFADTLLRAGVRLTTFDIEIVMGVSPRGSYCRDLLQTSQMLDLYFTHLGVPLHVILGYPAATTPDPLADPRLKPGAGHWQGGYSAATQAEWAVLASLCASKPYVRSVTWCHLSDAYPHLYPACGLIDAGDRARPALARLRALREQHLQ